MINPWLELPTSEPFALAEDLETILAFNKSASLDLCIHLELLPEPFIGDPSAPIVVLALNPGFSPDDPRHHKTAQFIELSRRNLRFENERYPFFLLDPTLEAPGRVWWEKKLSRLINAKGRETVAQKVLCVEYFPYHSRRFAHAKLQVPSQAFSLQLIHSAIAREAIIVLLRSEKLWLKSIPELATYERLYRIKNPQNVVITRNNCPDGYDSILTKL